MQKHHHGTLWLEAVSVLESWVGAFVLTKDLRFESWNSRFSGIFIGNKLTFLSETWDSLFKDSIPGNQTWKSFLENKDDWAGEITYNLENGDIIFLDVILKKKKIGTNEFWLGIAFDITERKLSEMQMYHDAFHDYLTNLPNRSLFLVELEKLIHQKKKESSFAIAVMNIDDFKKINSSFSHLVGDQILITISEKLVQFAGNKNHVCRISADTFVILFPDTDYKSAVLSESKKILEEMQKPFKTDNGEIFVSMKMGAAIYPIDASDGEELIRNAEIAMFTSKEKIDPPISFFQKDQFAKIFKEMDVERQIRKAIRDKQFITYFQPILSTSDSKLWGFEALVRWQHPQSGIIPPDVFIPIAEKNNLMNYISDFVIWDSATFLQEALEIFKDLKIAVNVSVTQFRGGDVGDRLTEVTKSLGLPS